MVHSALPVMLLVMSCAYMCTASYLPKCRAPHAPAYGSFSPRKYSYSIGSKVRFTCRHSYLLTGYSFSQCVYNRYTRKAVWRYSSPVCKPKVRNCPNLDDPQYGNVELTGNKPGSKATYTCDDGFTLSGASVRKCQSNGRWTGKAPTCKPILCPKLDDIDYGSVDDGDNRPGTEAVYTCDDGFRLVGEENRVCQDNGEWDGEEPVCELIICPDLDDPDYGSVDDGDNLPGTKAMYMCDDGFELVGSSKRLCQDDGTWAGEAPICERIVCPDLDDPDYGSVDDGDNLPGTKAMYMCDDGFELVGSSKRLCQDDGTWAGEAPFCELIICPDLDDPDYGSVDDGDNLPGTKAMYMCDDGFELVGSSKRLCQDDGTWAGEAPICERIVCPDLDDPDYGSVDDGDNLPGTKAMYTCDDGFELVGSSKRLCQDDGTWAGEAPTCERITCPDLDDPRYGDVNVRGNNPGDKAIYTCNKGFKLVGSSSRKCQANGEWSGDAPTCKRTSCPRPPKPKYGWVKYKSTSHGSKAYHSCAKGYKLVGNRVRRCRYGSWTGSTPTCRRSYYHDD